MTKKSSLLKTWRKKFLFWLIPFLVFWLVRLIYATLRIEWVGTAHRDGLDQRNQSYLLTLWHNNVVFAPILNRNRNIRVLISSSDDGELITRVVKRFGNDAFRGSSTRGGRAALAAMQEHLQKGGSGAITPDGPVGPLYEVKAGAVVAASRCKVPILPFHYECDRQWVLRSWDRTKIPKPFARMVVSFGEPYKVTAGDTDADLEKARMEVTLRLNRNMQQCLDRVAPQG